MKKHLFTAALAIVAIGTVYATHADTKTSSKTSRLADVFNSSTGCNTPINCEAPSGTLCTVSIPGGTWYDQPGCETEPIPAPTGFRSLD